MDRLESALRSTAPALVVALLATIAGGIVSAATAHAASRPASWAAAYLVLVGGVATLGLALGRGLLAPVESASRRRSSLELSVWVTGNGLVLGGNLAELRPLLAAGSVLLVVALVLVVWATMPDTRRGVADRGVAPPWVRWCFTAIVIVLAVSIPIGNVLATLD